MCESMFQSAYDPTYAHGRCAD